MDRNKQQRQTTKMELSQTLPLEWTRVQRRTGSSGSGNSTLKKRPKASTDVATDNDREGSVHPQRTSTTQKAECTEAKCMCRRVNDDELFVSSERATSINSDQYTYYSGSVIFCLPDDDCDWFQGYYFPFHDSNHDDIDPVIPPIGTRPYYGLLCHVKKDIDECLQCTAGGYREISRMELTLMNRTTPSTSQQRYKQQYNITTVPPQQMNISNIYWLGGDMMNLSMTNNMRPTTETSGSSSTEQSKHTNIAPTIKNIAMSKATSCVVVSMLRMKATTIYTGTKAIRYVQQYFNSLIRHLLLVQQHANDVNEENPYQKENENKSNNINSVQSSDESIIQRLMPNVAIVVGNMDIWMSK
jgi:hypothetical protein